MKKFATLMQNNWLVETPQAQKASRADRPRKASAWSEINVHLLRSPIPFTYSSRKKQQIDFLNIPNYPQEKVTKTWRLPLHDLGDYKIVFQGLLQRPLCLCSTFDLNP